ncbi:MAG: ribonuclease P protein component [bacterium]
MFPKKNRADKKAIEKVFKKGTFVGCGVLGLKYLIEDKSIPLRISFVVPKTVEKKAVRRNFLKRKGYIVLKKHWNKIPEGFLGVFLFNKNQKTEKLSGKIEEDIKNILNKI